MSGSIPMWAKAVSDHEILEEEFMIFPFSVIFFSV